MVLAASLALAGCIQALSAHFESRPEKAVSMIGVLFAAILAVATGAKRPVVKNDALAIATVMTCTLSADHRVVDGALGARWMREFKTIVEDPLSLML